MIRQEIRKILRDDVERFRVESQITTAKFNEILNGIPSDLPHPDDIQRIRNASIENAAALTRLRLARKRETDFILHGTVPNDLNQFTH